MFCMRCGRELPDTAAFCAACGQPAKQTVAPPPAYTAAPAPPPPVAGVSAYAPAPALKGVGGALLFFCICFTVLWPFWTLIQYGMTGFSIFSRFTPFALFAPVRVVFGIVVGVVLWTGQAAAIMLLRIYFAFAALLTLWSLFNVIQFALRYHGGLWYMRSLVTGLAPSIVFLVAGIIYFSVSERVRATYGSKLF
jgi:hypothetical protein